MESHIKKPFKEERPWGNFIEFTLNEPSTVKLLTINSGEAFSLQYHHHRQEFWHILAGNGTITIGNNEVPVIPGEDHFIEHGQQHRITAGTENVLVLEIGYGVFDENDIIRIDDRYGRPTPQ